MSDDFDFMDQEPTPKPSAPKPSVPAVPSDISIMEMLPRVDKRKYEDGDMNPSAFGDDEKDLITKNSRFQPLTPTQASFDPRLAFEIALGTAPVEDIVARYDLTPDEWFTIQESPLFKQSVLKYQEELVDGGVSFRLKAKIQAEAYLQDAHNLIKSPLTPPSVKADMIKWTAKVADLEPKSNGNEGVSFNLQINL